jgi:hypothetical protein
LETVPQEARKSEDNIFFVNLMVNDMLSDHVVLSAPIVSTEGFNFLLPYGIKDCGVTALHIGFIR